MPGPKSRLKRPPARRMDPPTRSPDGAMPWDKLKNFPKDEFGEPRMHYVYGDPSHARVGGVAYLESFGYQQALALEGGVRSVLGSKGGTSGSVINVLDMILMQIPRTTEYADEIGWESTGAFRSKEEMDAPGQARIDAMDKKMISKRGFQDNVRGQLADAVTLQNETTGGGTRRIPVGAL